MKQRNEYEDYRDSGIFYLGNVPRLWETKQLKRSVEGCVNGVWGAEPTGDDGDLVVIRVADFDRPKLRVADIDYTLRSIPEKDRKRRLLRNGDLLLEKSGGGENQQVGQVVIFDRDVEAVTSNFVARLRPLPNVDGNYLNYVFSSLYRDRLNTCSIKQNTGIQNLDSSAYLAEQWAFPSHKEQKQIASFLDYETAKIDALIEKQQQLIALLGEKRQAVISHAVTKGLNPDAPMRDSGVEWLGEVPEHWKATRLKFLVSEVVDCHHSTPEYDDEAPWPALRTSDISAGVLDVKNARRVHDNEYHHRISRLKPEAGDVIYAREGGRWGIAAPVPEGADVCLAQRVMLLRGNDRMLSPFVMWSLNSRPVYHQLAVNVVGSASPHVNIGDVLEVWLAEPPINEQPGIITELEYRLGKLDALDEQCGEVIETLQERRTALISAAVTGKIDVRGWKRPSAAPKKETEMEVA